MELRNIDRLGRFGFVGSGFSLTVILVAFLFCGCVGLSNIKGPPAAPVPPPGTAAELTAGTETKSRVWSPTILATQFSGAAAEVVDEAVTAANMDGDVAHGVSQNALIDYLMATIDPDGDGSIADSSLSIADLTLTGAVGLVLGVAGTTLGTARWYTNVAANVYRFDLFSSDFTQNWGIRWQTGYPTENGGLFTVGTTGTGTWSYQGVDPGDLLLLPADPAAHVLFGFDNTTNTYKPFTIGTGLSFDQASSTLSATAGSDAFTVKVDAAATADYLYDGGVGAIRAGTNVSIDDNGDYITLNATAGSATLDAIGDPVADGTIAQAGYKLTLTSTLNTAGSIWTFTNTTADLTADVSFIDLKLTDDADANGYFLRGYDNAGVDLKWSIGADGAFTTTGTITAPSFASSAVDGARYSTLPNNTTGNEPLLTAGESGFYSFETLLYMYENGTKVGRVMGLTGGTNLNPDAADGAALGSATLEWSDLFLADASVINFGADQDVTLTHVPDTGILLNGAMQLQLRDSTEYIASLNDGYVDIEAATAVRINTDLVVSGTIGGLVASTTDADGQTLTSAMQKGYIHWATGAGTINLAAITAGDSFCVHSTTAAAVVINPDDADVIWLNGATLSAGDSVTSDSTAGAQICFIAQDATNLRMTSRTGTWTDTN